MELVIGHDITSYDPVPLLSLTQRHGVVKGELGYIVGRTPFAAVSACLDKGRLTLCSGLGIQDISTKSGSHHLFSGDVSFRINSLLSVGYKHMSNGARLGWGRYPNYPADSITITVHFNVP